MILFKTIQFSISMHFSLIWTIDRSLSGVTIPGLSGPGSDSNEVLFYIPQSSSIIGASPSDCLPSYIGHSLMGSYPSENMKSVYSTALTDWAMNFVDYKLPFVTRLEL